MSPSLSIFVNSLQSMLFDIPIRQFVNTVFEIWMFWTPARVLITAVSIPVSLVATTSTFDGSEECP